MVSVTVVKKGEDARDVINAVREELLSVGLDNDDAILALPTLYPGGAPVVVRIRRDGESYIVNDQGGGYLEAEHLGGSLLYGRLAPSVAQKHSVKYDGSMMFAMEVGRDWLANAVIFIAAASRKAVELRAKRMAEQ